MTRSTHKTARANSPGTKRTGTDSTASRSSRRAREAEDHVRRMHLLVTIGVTAVATIAYLAVIVLTRPDLPATMATHFGVSGAADSFMRTPLALLFQGVAVIGVPLALLVVFGVGQWWRGEGARPLSALISGLSAGLTTLFVMITVRHVGIEDPATVTLDWTVGALALGIGAVVAVLAALLLPPALPQPAPDPVEPLRIAPSDRVSWFGAAHTSRTALIVLAIGVLVLAGSAIASGIVWLWLVVLLMLVLVLAVTRFSVTIDSHGVTWRSALGFPRGGVALADIASASAVDVHPGDFGGYGLRFMPRRKGIITRSGRALRIEHGNGALVITVDDADTAASVVEGLRLRRKG